MKVTDVAPFVLALLAVVVFLSPATAMIAPHKASALRASEALASRTAILIDFAGEPEYQITDQTEIKLNGHRCSYDEVPAGAEILFMEIDSHISRNILRIHFRHRK